jgi:NAD(P)-dependent dehydrogenase (short-subunit alcohol dehydrogenase family)
MTMASYMITGCSRGIGLEMVRQLAAQEPSTTGTIIATARSQTPPPELAYILNAHPGRVHFLPLDLEDLTTITAAAAHASSILAPHGLDILINNAGINLPEPSVLSANALEKTLAVNVLGVRDVTLAFLPLLRLGTQKKIINISTTVGTFGMAPIHRAIPAVSYKISKAALNMLTLQYAFALEGEGFTVVGVSPGWLKTELGGEGNKEYAHLEVGVGVRAALEVISGVGKEDSGTLKNICVPEHEMYASGEDLAW